MSDLDLFRDGEAPCPACGAPITFKRSADGCSVDIMHPHADPEPRCEGFEAFCQRLRDRVSR